MRRSVESAPGERIPAREADYQLASPCELVDIPQTYLEPILVRNATARGTQTRFSTEYVSHSQDATGVDVQVRDRLTGYRYTIRAKYLIGADGARSMIATDIGLPFEGTMDIAGSMNITFKADIAAHVGASALGAVLGDPARSQRRRDRCGPGADGSAMERVADRLGLRHQRRATRSSTKIEAIKIVRQLLGIPDLDVEITGASLWGNNETYATNLQRGRVFCVGDAVHRHPPSNGLGSNTSIQDSYNLAWKLAAVLKGQADPRLLGHLLGRARAGRRADRQAREQVQPRVRPVLRGLGLLDAEDDAEMVARIDERKANTPRGAAKRAALVDAMDLKNYEFNAHGVDLGQFYQSAAVISDGSVLPTPTRDPDLFYEMSTVPGSHLPHAWVGDNRTKLALMDVAPYTRWTVITGIAGEAWAGAADKIGHELGIALQTVVIGPGRDVTDLYYDWAKLREIGEDGAVLVRPDKHIAWRAMTMPDRPYAELRSALAQILGRD